MSGAVGSGRKTRAWAGVALVAGALTLPGSASAQDVRRILGLEDTRLTNPVDPRSYQFDTDFGFVNGGLLGGLLGARDRYLVQKRENELRRAARSERRGRFDRADRSLRRAQRAEDNRGVLSLGPLGLVRVMRVLEDE